MRLGICKRGGAAIVEAAVVLPIAIMIILAIISGALIVFDFQEVAAVSREASRYASVRGDSYAQSTGLPPATSLDVYNNVILPQMIKFNVTKLTYSVTWSPDNRQGSSVTVIVTCQISDPIYGNLTISSSSTSQVTW